MLTAAALVWSMSVIAYRCTDPVTKVENMYCLEGPTANAYILPGITPVLSTKKECEAMGDWSRKQHAARLKLKDYRILKYMCLEVELPK